MKKTDDKLLNKKCVKKLDKKATILVFDRQFCSHNPRALIVLPLEKIIISINQDNNNHQRRGELGDSNITSHMSHVEHQN